MEQNGEVDVSYEKTTEKVVLGCQEIVFMFDELFRSILRVS